MNPKRSILFTQGRSNRSLHERVDTSLRSVDLFACMCRPFFTKACTYRCLPKVSILAPVSNESVDLLHQGVDTSHRFPAPAFVTKVSTLSSFQNQVPTLLSKQVSILSSKHRHSPTHTSALCRPQLRVSTLPLSRNFLESIVSILSMWVSTLFTKVSILAPKISILSHQVSYWNSGCRPFQCGYRHLSQKCRYSHQRGRPSCTGIVILPSSVDTSLESIDTRSTKLTLCSIFVDSQCFTNTPNQHKTSTNTSQPQCTYIYT